MTPAELRALVAKATPGPWQMDDESTICAHNEVIAVPCGVFGRDQQDADMELIVAAVNALPALLDRLEAAERDRDMLLSAAKRAWALCYDDRGAMNILAAAIAAQADWRKDGQMHTL